MPTTPANALGDDPAPTTTPMPTAVDVTLHFSARALAWLADHPQARTLVRSVSDILTELEQAGHHPKPIAALRRVLTLHQPTPAGRCPTCPRATWRRRPFPCTVWHQIHGELLGVFTPSGRGTDRRPAQRWPDGQPLPDSISKAGTVEIV